ncbi:MAG: GNAT family N-acetyltransferase [Hyphomonadaceae bacterium]|nr:GNAT family N-acetyltransferase [Hyphomonadaceae bacterium]
MAAGARAFWAPAQGFILVHAAADEAEILTLAVAEPARRRGLARALVSRAEAEMRDSGARTFFLEVSAANAAARALYATAGFMETGRRARYYDDGADALILSRALV